METVPLGSLHADVIVACLDSRRSRQWVNQAAWRLGVPWLDAAVDAKARLVRVNGYLPAPAAPCLECSWGPDDYGLLELDYACQGIPEIAATAAPAELGALAAALQAGELRKLLMGQRDQTLLGRQVIIDVLHHRHHVAGFQANPRCLFDHEIRSIERVERSPAELTLPISRVRQAPSNSPIAWHRCR